MHDVGRPLPVIVNCVPTHPRRLMVPRYPDTRFKVNDRRPPEPLTDEKKNQVFHNQSIRYPFRLKLFITFQKPGTACPHLPYEAFVPSSNDTH
jgi:hypothetical protein